MEEKEEEVEEEAGRGETRQRRVIDPEKGSSAVGPVRCSSGGLQQPSTPGFSCFYHSTPSLPPHQLTLRANKGWRWLAKGVWVATENRELVERGRSGTCATAKAWMQQSLCEMGNLEETGGVVVVGWLLGGCKSSLQVPALEWGVADRWRGGSHPTCHYIQQA